MILFEASLAQNVENVVYSVRVFYLPTDTLYISLRKH